MLHAHGFLPETSINLVSTCRDELCRPFVDLLDAVRPIDALVSRAFALRCCI